MPDKEKLSSSILLLFGKSFGGQSLPFPEVLRDYLETKLEEAITNPEAANWEIFQAAVISHGKNCPPYSSIGLTVFRPIRHRRIRRAAVVGSGSESIKRESCTIHHQSN